MKISLWCLIVTVLAMAGCSPRRAEKTEGKLLVVASIAPMADFARRVGGDRAQVEQMIPPGASPHTFEPTTRQMRSLANADVLILNGRGLEFWADKAISAAGNPRLKVVDTSASIHDVLQDETDHGERSLGNPHFWLDPMLAAKQVDAIADAFCQADKAGESTYRNNAAAFKLELKQLDKQITASVAKFGSREFIAMHPAWVYFARRYGLKQAAVIEESPGKEPSTAYLRGVIDTVRRVKAKAIFAEPQLPTKAAEVIASETGAKVLILDPLGKPPHQNYVSNMLNNVRIMASGL